MTTIHLVRHGEVDNPDGILYGRLPHFGLTERGHEMAVRVAEHFHAAPTRPVELVASPLLRAQQTIRPLSKSLDLPVFDDDRVIEAANSFEGQKL
ncbi:MAG: histidine phosphatase family protein, partial [Brevibacterium linens]